MGSTVSKDGTVIAFDRHGDGPPVILVHPAFGHRSFNPEMGVLAEHLASRFTVFNYDRRGRGESGDTAPYDVEREIEDIDALIGEAGAPAFVYGMSSGAALALEAANRGLAITKLALYEAPYIVDDTRPAAPPGYLARLTELAAASRRGDTVEHFLTNGVGVPAEQVAQMRDQPMWPEFENVAHTLVYDATIMDGTLNGQPLPAERVASVSVPTLVIVGSAAPPWAQNSAKALADALPHARLSTLDGEFHAVTTETLAPALAEFFAA